MKFDTLPFEGEWYDAFGTPESRGVWIVWGKSGSGKTSFVMKLCKELCKYGRVVYDSLEEGISLTMQNTVRRSNMLEANRRFLLVCESMDELSLRLKRQKSPDFCGDRQLSIYADDIRPIYQVQGEHKNKLLIFVSHASGQNPDGRSAKKVQYDASLKIYVEGKRAFSHGRFIGPKGYYDIWQEEAEIYFGDKPILNDENE